MRILILDDDECRHDVFRRVLADAERVHVYTAKQAIEALSSERFDLVCLDHDLDLLSESLLEPPGDGLEVARFIADHMPVDKVPRQVLVHSWNPCGARAMVDTLKAASVPVVRREFSVSMPWLKTGAT